MKGCLANQADLDTEWNLFIGKTDSTGPQTTWNLKMMVTFDARAGSEGLMTVFSNLKMLFAVFPFVKSF